MAKAPAGPLQGVSSTTEDHKRSFSETMLLLFSCDVMGPDQSASIQRREVELQSLCWKAVVTSLVHHPCRGQLKIWPINPAVIAAGS